MKIGVISDIHGNLQALESVLESIYSHGIKELYCLGDIIGYGADPEACIKLIQKYAKFTIIGNHEAALLGKFDLNKFNPKAKAALKWTGNHLSSDSLNYISSLEYIHKNRDFTLVHGSLIKPENFKYIKNEEIAEENLKICSTVLCFFGHTHKPQIFHQVDNQTIIENKDEFYYQDGPILANPDSVGQPRGEDLRTSYLIWDKLEQKIERFRLNYDVNLAVKRIQDEKIPLNTGENLLKGYEFDKKSEKSL